ncbi:MAG TPA: phospho-sugar mutase [Acidimicrobiales bacterium]|nr:phospho-sugar mutase [Acidimicrobiales bacterium]
MSASNPWSASLVDRARRWADEDPDPATRAETERMLEAHDADGLQRSFGGRLQFGTAGLRGELGPGPNHMNRALVRRAAAGLAHYLGPGSRVVVGYDARHMSAEFATDSAAVFAGAGLDAVLLPRPLPTPVLAFTVRHLRGDAGVMVTASHNPARDNGYKVYLGDGAQIIPPADADISRAIDGITTLSRVPLDDGFTVAGDSVVDAYLDAIGGVIPAVGPRGVRIVYTAMHGVGAAVAEQAFARAGFGDVHPVAAQEHPDPDFPTVSFPNPEEPGALDLAFAEAERTGADIILANDPDADRLAVAVGGTKLTGDQVGCLIADYLLRQPNPGGATRLVVSSIVSSTLLGRIAADYGARYERTLTGFKWIVRPALAHPNWQFVLGYEEALGYSVHGIVHDKDGISAALVVAELAAELKQQGLTLEDRLDELDRRYGRYRTAQRAFRLPSDEQQAAMVRVRAQPGAREVGPDVVEVGGEGWRVIFRPSGTEPKLKVYAEAVDGDVDAVVARAAEWAGLA